jgi:hypothetical protein
MGSKDSSSNLRQEAIENNVKNMTVATIDENELSLPNKGLNHNLKNSKKNECLEMLVIQTAAAISRLRKRERKSYIQLAKCIIDNTIQDNSLNKCQLKEIVNAHWISPKAVPDDMMELKINIIDEIVTEVNNYEQVNGETTRKNPTEQDVLESICSKVAQHNLVITQTDDSNTVVILNKTEYQEMIRQFIDDNKNIFEEVRDETETFQKAIIDIINKCPNVINTEELCKFRQMNPKAPTSEAQIKIDKTNFSIRPIVDYEKAPVYKVAKYITPKLKKYFNLKYTYNFENSLHFAQTVRGRNMYDNDRMMSLRICNLYTSIPQNYVIKIIKSKLKKDENLSREERKELINLIEITIKQNYFESGGKFWIQKQGIPMESPISSVIVDIYLQDLENKYSKIIDNESIKYIKPYVNNILIIYDSKLKKAKDILADLKKVSGDIKYTLDKANKKAINFIDLELRIEKGKIVTGLHHEFYTTIHHTSNHPIERLLIHLIQKLPITEEVKSKEYNKTKQFAKNEGYELSESKFCEQPTIEDDNQKELVEFTYFGPQIRFLTKIFKYANIRIAYKVDNTIKQNISLTQQVKDKYSYGGIYKLQCKGCDKIYIGQTRVSFTVRYGQHKSEIKCKKPRCGYTKHIVESKHQHGDSVEETMEILKRVDKPEYLDTYEKFYICKYKREGNILNVQHINYSNELFDLLLNEGMPT